MKKRILAALLVVIMLCAVLPMGFATEQVNASFEVRGDNAHGADAHTEYVAWIESETVDVSAGTTAAELIEQIFTAGGYDFEGLENGYLNSVTNPDGVTLETGTNGPNSGWMYTVNGVFVEQSLVDYVLEDGDAVVLMYVDDYATEIDWNEDGFDDVKPGDWYYDYVVRAVEKSIFNGVSETEFRPNENMTRAMMAEIIFNIEGRPVLDVEPKGHPLFDDVGVGSWFYDSAIWCAYYKVMNGYGDGTFGSLDNITREQLVLTLYNYASLKEYDTTQGGMAIREFADYESISDWALESMEWAVNTGLIQGQGENMIVPGGYATRAEAAAIMLRFLELYDIA